MRLLPSLMLRVEASRGLKGCSMFQLCLKLNDQTSTLASLADIPSPLSSLSSCMLQVFFVSTQRIEHSIDSKPEIDSLQGSKPIHRLRVSQIYPWRLWGFPDLSILLELYIQCMYAMTISRSLENSRLYPTLFTLWQYPCCPWTFVWLRGIWWTWSILVTISLRSVFQGTWCRSWRFTHQCLQLRPHDAIAMPCHIAGTQWQFWASSLLFWGPNSCWTVPIWCCLESWCLGSKSWVCVCLVLETKGNQNEKWQVVYLVAQLYTSVSADQLYSRRSCLLCTVW